MSLTRSQYNELIRGYDSRRSRALQDAQTRKAKLFAACPELREVHNSIVENRSKAIQAGINGDDALVDRLNAEAAVLKDRQASLLFKSGITEDDLQPRYTCPACKDTGYIGNEKCHCLQQNIVIMLYHMSNLDGILERENFETLSMKYYSTEEQNGRPSQYAEMEGKISLLRNFTANFASAPDSLLLFGPTGVGKTFLTHCIAKELIEQGFSVSYFTASELIDLLADKAFRYDAYDEDADSEKYFMESDMLIIDDLGTERSNRFSAEKLFTVINGRELTGKSTVISTNLSPDEIRENYSERLASRIIGSYRLLHIEGRDIRILKRYENLH